MWQGGRAQRPKLGDDLNLLAEINRRICDVKMLKDPTARKNEMVTSESGPVVLCGFTHHVQFVGPCLCAIAN